ncbi:MAG: hypothetical protein RMJ84_10520 [Sandaracinaceae bacterium]|nr:hypothetical protein [Sandaracinaceae bacterium]
MRELLLWSTLIFWLWIKGCGPGGEGSNCEINQDCAQGLLCCTASCSLPARGFCRKNCEGITCGQDGGTGREEQGWDGGRSERDSTVEGSP